MCKNIHKPAASNSHENSGKAGEKNNESVNSNEGGNDMEFTSSPERKEGPVIMRGGGWHVEVTGKDPLLAYSLASILSRILSIDELSEEGWQQLLEQCTFFGTHVDNHYFKVTLKHDGACMPFDEDEWFPKKRVTLQSQRFEAVTKSPTPLADYLMARLCVAICLYATETGGWADLCPELYKFSSFTTSLGEYSLEVSILKRKSDNPHAYRIFDHYDISVS